jgi:acetyl esterase/lipase
VLLQVGSTELLLDDSRRMHDRILAAGGESRLTVYEGVAHAWHLLVPYVPEATSAVREAATFIREHLALSDATRRDGGRGAGAER